MRKAIFLIFMLTAIGCQNSNSNNELMNHDEMVNYLVTLHIAEAEVQNLRLKKDSSEAVFKLYEKYLQKEQGISDSLFVRSYNYYLSNPEQLEQIYEAVVDSISVRKSIEDVAK